MTNMGTRPNCAALARHVREAVDALDAWAETADDLADPAWAHRFGSVANELLGKASDWQRWSREARQDYDKEIRQHDTRGSDSGQEGKQEKGRFIIRG